jgi:hypothetical protein
MFLLLQGYFFAPVMNDGAFMVEVNDDSATGQRGTLGKGFRSWRIDRD